MRNLKRISNKHLGELLIERGVVTREQVEMAIAYQKEKGGLVGEVLVELGYASEENIAQALTCQYGFPYLPLENYEIAPEAVGSVPEDVCHKFCLVPVDKIDQRRLRPARPARPSNARAPGAGRTHVRNV